MLSASSILTTSTLLLAAAAIALPQTLTGVASTPPRPERGDEARLMANQSITRVGRFYVGGRTVSVAYPNAGNNTPTTGASMVVEQALVHSVTPSVVTEPYPIVMIAGLGLSSYLYMATPDGREGWASLMARKGFQVYVFEDPLMSPSGGFNINAFNGAKRGQLAAADQPQLSIWTNEEIWSRWGFGSAFNVPYSDTRFPVAHVDQFYAAMPIQHDYPAGSGQFGAGFKSELLVELLDRVGPAILMAHSAAGQTVLQAASARLHLVPGFVLLEPAGIPDAGDFPAFSGKFMLGIYGDYIAQRNQTGRKQATEDAAVLFNQNGGVGEVISMPEDLNVFGNTHIMMQDNNSHDIAAIVVNWLRTNAY
jgi:pimeloyl-ACP methyl ester carboxylesterase